MQQTNNVNETAIADVPAKGHMQWRLERVVSENWFAITLSHARQSRP